MGDTRIVVDAMGGDYAPEWIIRGAVEAVNEGAKAHIILTGKEAVIKGELAKYTYDTSKIEIKTVLRRSHVTMHLFRQSEARKTHHLQLE